MPRYKFTRDDGTGTQVYYGDGVTYGALEAVPGEVYDLPAPPDHYFQPVDEPKSSKKE